MSGFCDRFSCEDCCEGIRERFEDKRNMVASAVSGAFFFVGWWILIDTACTYTSGGELHKAYHIAGALGTLSFFMVNALSNGVIRGDVDTCLSPMVARIWLFLGFMLAFGAVIASIWIFIQGYVTKQSQTNPPPVWAGIGIMAQNLCIFLASSIYKFARKEEDSSF
ncbi:transmembrane protein 50A-like [Symsagittifera roscoffensis]|uniref:transmembrane protein 50A-like n=1 Tax=Symsagittifera roscoffensis TaxID=84072 RepID=UPI00307C6054